MPLPPKPKAPPDDLAEVDRALSVLQGRHPEHERTRREDAEARRKRADTLDREARVESTAKRSRYLRVGAIAVPLVALVAFVGLLGRRELSRRARVEAAGEPYRAFGFTTVDTSSPSSTGALEASLDPGCFVALSTEAAPLKVTRAGNVTDGVGPTLFCTCVAERISVASSVGSAGGLLMMRADPASIGGSRAFGYAPFKPGTTIRADEACNEASLDAWVEAKHSPAPATEGPWLAAWPKRVPLVAAGFRVMAVAAPSMPFVVVELPKDSCVLATSSVADDKLALRLKGGATAVADAAGTFTRCAQADGTVLVTREGTGEVAVLVAPATALGGLQGLRELARDNGLSLGTTVVAGPDRAWDAKQILLASQIPEASITTASAPNVPADSDARVAGLSFETPNALVPESPVDLYSYCDPPLDAKMTEATCVFSGPQKWRTEGGAEVVGGIARAKLPFWLFTMQSANEPVALKGITQLFALARHLGRDGFAPTTLDALTELPLGVEVLGRMGEDAIVAVGVAGVAPWVYPLTDGPAWTLDEAPRIVALKPLEKVTLSASLTAKLLPPKASRRTVVWRRQKH